MGQKDWLDELSVKILLIIQDPSTSANSLLGSRPTELVESIDLIPTFIEALGRTFPNHIIEGKSLKPLLNYESEELLEIIPLANTTIRLLQYLHN